MSPMKSYSHAFASFIKRVAVVMVHRKSLPSLNKRGYTGSIDRVQRIMKKAGIRSNITKKYRPTSSQKPVEERENLLAQDFTTETINEKWVADITYIHTLRDGWCYLASVFDLHTKKIVGYKFGRKMTVDLVLDALDNAVHAQNPAPGLIVHTDLGTQYTSVDVPGTTKKI